MPTIGRVTANRYVQPLREGGSLPAVVDTDDGLFVVTFRGAGQGPKALIAEVIVGLLAQAPRFQRGTPLSRRRAQFRQPRGRGPRGWGVCFAARLAGRVRHQS